MPFKHFNSRPQASREPLGFSIGKQEFHCVQTVPLGAFLGVAMAEGAKSLVEMVNFIREAIVEEEREIFDAMVDDSESGLTLDVFTDLSEFLMEYYFEDRPTGQPSSASPSSPSTGGGLTGGYSRPAQTYSNSQQTVAST